jgi:hypothetical protein
VQQGLRERGKRRRMLARKYARYTHRRISHDDNEKANAHVKEGCVGVENGSQAGAMPGVSGWKRLSWF